MGNNNIREQAIFFPTGDPATSWVDTLEYKGALGQRCTFAAPKGTDNEGETETWQQVLTDSTMSVAPAASAVVYWKDRAGYVVTTERTGRLGQVAGVIGGSGGAVSMYGFIQTEGKAREGVTFQGGPTSAPDATGKIVVPSTSADGVANCLGAGTAATYPPIGVSLSAAVDNVADVQLDCPPNP